MSHKSLCVCARRATHSAGIGKAPYTKHFRWPHACRGHIQHWFYQQVGLLYIHCDFHCNPASGPTYIHCDFTWTYILLPTVAERVFGNSLIPCFQFSWWWVVILRPQWCRVQHPKHIRKNQDISLQRAWLLQGRLIQHMRIYIWSYVFKNFFPTKYFK
jgi:hypothetical protein